MQTTRRKPPLPAERRDRLARARDELAQRREQLASEPVEGPEALRRRNRDLYQLRCTLDLIEEQLRETTTVGMPLARCACMEAQDVQAKVRWCLARSGLHEGVLTRATFASWNHTLNGDCREGYAACLGMSQSCHPDSAAANEAPWIALHGPPGTGKTHLLAATVGALCRSGVHAVFWPAHHLADDIFRRLNERTLDELVLHLRRVPFLALDDLGTEAGGDFVRTELHAILDARYLERRPTLISTNQDIDRFPPRLASRLGDAYVCQWVEMQGQDVRGMVKR